MPEEPEILIRSQQADDGSINAATFDATHEEEEQLSDDYNRTGVNCRGVRQLWARVKNAYPEDVQIGVTGPARDCIRDDDPRLAG